MDWFYTIVLIIAIVILIGALTVVGITITSQVKNNPFPDFQNTCPDFWSLNGSICSPPTDGINTPGPDKFTGIQPNVQHAGVTVSNGAIKSLDIGGVNWTSVCDKSSWANMNGIYWDGVTNNNACY
jgi:hypothetical protein